MYEDMTDLDNSLVEHILRSKEGLKQYQQLPKRIKLETQILVKEKMHKSEIIRVAKYNYEWLSNVVLVKRRMKK